MFNCTSNMKLPLQLGVILRSAFVYVKYEVTVTAWSYTAFCLCLTARQIWSYRHSLELYCVLPLFNCTSNMKLPLQLGVILRSAFVYVKYEVTVTAWSYTAFCLCLTARQIWSYRYSLELYCVLPLFTSNMKLPLQLGVILRSAFVYVKYEVTVTAWSYTAFCLCLRQIWSYRYSLELYGVLSFFNCMPYLNYGVGKVIRSRSTKQLHITSTVKTRYLGSNT